MRAIVCDQYGSSDVLRVADVEVPQPARDEALIRVRAASVNPLDAALFHGRPAALRVATGITRPGTSRPGVDFAGEVVSVGPDVRRCSPGEEVFGFCVTDPHARGLHTWAHHLGSFAEFLCVADTCFAPMPPRLSFEEAAAVPLAAVTALQGLRDEAHLESGQKVLINGAAGGVGTFAVQLAAAFGAEVTGVCRTGNLELVRALGAHHVIDYTHEDFTRGSAKYDILFDCIGNHTFTRCRRVLRPRGVCLRVGHMTDAGLLTGVAQLAAGLLVSRFTTEKLRTFLARPRRRDLLTLSPLLANGSVRPSIDRIYTLPEVPQAIRYLEGRHARGKVVIRIDDRAAS